MTDHLQEPSKPRQCRLSAAELTEIMQIVMRVGILMLRSGTISFRVEQAMQRIGEALGVERLDAYVTFTGIIASIHCGNQHYTQMARIKTIGTDMNRVSMVESLTRTMPVNADLNTIIHALNDIEKTRPLYPRPLVVLMIAIACGAFALIAGGRFIEFISAALGAGVGQAIRFRLLRQRLNPMPITVLCAAIATLVCFAVVELFAFSGWTTATPEYGFLASVLYLVPGVPMVTAALDLVRFDLVSGLSRLMYAVLLIFSIAIGVLITLGITRFTLP